MINIMSIIVKKLLLIVFVLSINITCLFAQLREDLKNELLVYIHPSALEFPTNEQKNIQIKNLKIFSSELKSTFSSFGINELQKVFPNVKDADTITVNEEGKEVRLPQMSRIFVLRMKNISDVDLAIAQLSKIPGILFAEKHSEMSLHNDDYFPDQWHLNNTGQTGGTPDADIDAPEAWQIFMGSSSVKLGVIDSGVEITHDDLTGKSSGDLPENYPYDSYAHGTHVAGISGAKHNNFGKVKGVDANVLVNSKKVFSGSVYDPSIGRDVAAWGGDNNAYNKIVEAVNEGSNTLNNSYGGPTNSTILRMAFAYAYKMNRVAVVSMGNKNSSTPSYPAAFGQGILAVGSTTDFDVRSYFSNYGSNIDVTAPGSSILSTWRGNDYNTISGTSMASPIVAGIATLLKGYNPNLYNDDIEQIIRISADDVNFSTHPGWDQYLGTGRVNAYNALRLLQAPYQLSQLSVSSGSIHSGTNNYALTIYGASGLQDGTYWVKRYEI
ncbi:MAG: S8 family serine peptidase, partial [Ignavibacterium sp.]|nr:S8 family serine peptidase [Ignavibacterium sp.]